MCRRSRRRRRRRRRAPCCLPGLALYPEATSSSPLPAVHQPPLWSFSFLFVSLRSAWVALPSFTEFYRVFFCSSPRWAAAAPFAFGVPSFTEFYRVLPSFFFLLFGFLYAPHPFGMQRLGNWAATTRGRGFLPSFTEFYRVFFCSLRVDGEVRPSFALETTQRERERERERTGGIPHSVGLTALSFVFQIETGMDANAKGPNKTEREREKRRLRPLVDRWGVVAYSKDVDLPSLTGFYCLFCFNLIFLGFT